MADTDFERQLVGLFGDAPHLPDTDAFARTVQGRLESGWRMRRWLIGGLGAVGGLVAAGQMAAASLQLQAQNVSLPSPHEVSEHLNAALAGPAAMAGLSPVSLLMSACLGLVAIALGLTRMVRAI